MFSMKIDSTLSITALLIAFFSVLQACSTFEPGIPDNEQLLDGHVDGLTHAQRIEFQLGDIAFNDEIFTTSDGLGPVFVATSCGSCHAGDGKGTPFTTLTRFGQIDSSGNQYMHMGGPQLQNRAIPGYVPEGIPIGATSSRFTPPANTGLGYLELVSDQDILAMADPYDVDGDGISGVPNWNVVPAFVQIPANASTRNGKYICRFGKKASTFDLLQQTVQAYNQDIGITSTFIPYDVASGLHHDPEVSDKTIRNVVLYLQTLKAPIQRTPDLQEVIAGKNTFVQIGCEACHKETLKTGPSNISALSNRTIHPYTDLLLHDLGSALDDGYTEGSAKTYEWRTAPLWGIGLSPHSQGGEFYLMHDGRAATIEEAIILHGGEATSSRDKYNQLTPAEKN